MTRTPGADPVRAATAELFARYLDIIEQARSADGGAASLPGTDLAHLAWLCREGIERIDAIPVDKASRWLGFVQGCLTMQGLISVEGERDHSRPLFHRAYAASGMAIPPRIGPAPHDTSGM